MDRKLLSGHILALLVDVAIDHKINEIPVNPDGVKQGRPFGRRRIRCDRCSLRFQTAQQPGKFPLQGVDSCGKIAEVSDPIEPPCLLMRKLRLHACINALLWLDVQAKRAAVNRKMLDLVEIETMTAKQLIERSDREIAEMLVVNRIKFAMLDQRLDVGCFDHSHAIVL